MKISKNFTIEEFTHSNTAKKYSIPNIPGIEETKNIHHLVTYLLQPLRTAYGKAIYISSGYRCPKLNKRVGGVPSSQHVKGEAVDCMVEGSVSELLDILKVSPLPFDQAILYRKRNFLHLSLKESGNRKQVINRD